MPYIRHTAMLLLAAALLSFDAQAQMETLRYKVGNVAFAEDVDKIQIQSSPPVLINILPGGRTWPPLKLDENGHIFAGASVIDPDTGKHINVDAAKMPETTDSVLLPADLRVTWDRTAYRLRLGHVQCTAPYKSLGAPKGKLPVEALQDANVMLAASDEKIIALVTSFQSDGQTANYHLRSIEPRTCKVSEIAKLGDPDLLVELGRSTHGGWWITGSIEQTLMTSKDGVKWRRVKLPKGLSSLVSSYVMDDKQIWLAGILGNSEAHPNLLVYSDDGGTSWVSLKKNDPLLSKIPAGWLEGQKRKALK